MTDETKPEETPAPPAVIVTDPPSDEVTCPTCGTRIKS